MSLDGVIYPYVFSTYPDVGVGETLDVDFKKVATLDNVVI
jgi:hypothetical protein